MHLHNPRSANVLNVAFGGGRLLLLAPPPLLPWPGAALEAAGRGRLILNMEFSAALWPSNWGGVSKFAPQ